MSEQRREIGYYNTSTKEVIPGYSHLYHGLSSSRSEVDENGHVKYIEYFDGNPREVMLNIKGQLSLDSQRRGGQRLWERIYDQADLVAKLEARGVDTGSKSMLKDTEEDDDLDAAFA